MLRSIPIIEPSRIPPRLPFSQPFQPDPALRLWLLPQRDGKWYDYSGHGNHGTITGAVWKPTPAGPGLYFDGVDDYLDCGSDTSLDITDQKSIGVWVKIISWTDWRDVWGKGADSADRINLELWNDSTLVAYMRTGDVGQVAIPSNIISINEWNYLEYTIDDTAQILQLYHNGVLTGEDTDFTLPDTSDASLVVGALNSTLNLSNSLVGSFSIYNRARSADESRKTFEIERAWFGV